MGGIYTVKNLSIITSSHAGCGALQVNSLDRIANLGALTNEVAKILPRDLALVADLAGFFTFGPELFDGALEADSEIICRETENFAHR